MVKSLVNITLLHLSKTYLKLLDDIEINGVKNGIILTNVGDVIFKLRADIPLFYLLYISLQYDALFDAIINTHNTIVLLEEIVN